MHLVDLISPISQEVFFEQYWEAEYLYLARNDPSYFSSLFSLKNLDYLLGYLPEKTKIKLADASMDPENAASSAEAGIHGLSNIYDRFYQGSTVIVDSLHTLWEPVARLCHNILLETNMKTQVNMYVTPAGGTGFGCHWDGHDVMILQVEGRKHWRIYNPIPYLPRPDSHGDAYNTGEEPLKHITMQPGDVLYLPRGMPHEATAADEPSIHLTLGIRPVIWEHLIVEAVQELANENESLRKSLPNDWFTNSASVKETVSSYRGFIKELLSESILEQAIDSLRLDLLRKSSALPDGHFSHVHLVDEISLDTIVERRSGNLIQVVKTDQGPILFFPGGAQKGPGKIFWFYTFVATTPSFRVGEIPGWYSDEERLIMVKSLVRQGFLRIISITGE